MNANDRSITLFTMLGHGMFHAYELSIPIFVAVWLDVFVVSEAALGLAVGIGVAIVGIFAPLGGILSDLYGSKRLVMLAILGMGTGFLLVGLSSDLIGITLALAIWGFSASLYHPAGLSLISRGVEQRGLAIGYHGAAGSAGTALGPFIVLLLLIVLDWRTVAALSFLPAVIALYIGWRIDFEPNTAVKSATAEGQPLDPATRLNSVRELIDDTVLLFTGGFILVFIINMGYGMYFRGIFTFLPDLLADLPLFIPADLFGRSINPGRYVYSGLLLVGVLGQWAGGRLSEGPHPERSLFVVLALLTVVSLFFIPATGLGVFPFLIVCGALGFVLFLAAPITLTLVADYADPELHGLSYGYTYFGLFGVGSIGAAGAGIVLTYTDSSVLFTLLAGLSVVGMTTAIFLYWRN